MKQRKEMKISITKFVFLAGAMLTLVSVVAGQTPPTPPQVEGTWQKPKPKAAPVAVASPVPIVAEARTVAPQVVTIVHRLNGIKLLRLLRRASGDQNSVSALNDKFKIEDEVHTNILAGVALDDGHTIATWLPQAMAELEAFKFPVGTLPPIPGFPGAPVPETPVVPAISNAGSHLTVFGRDGKEVRARYVGLDGQTGISVLRISGFGFEIPVVETQTTVVTGQKLRLFAPQGAAPGSPSTAGRVYVRVGESEAKVVKLQRMASGPIERLVARGVNLSPSVVGGIAIDDAGSTVGIIESVSGMEASIIPLATIRQAAKRVIDRQASVPRPLLGVRGEAIGVMPQWQLLSNGWAPAEATALLNKRMGIMLTAVVPGTPAALAHLRPGDVILSVNAKDIMSAQEFSALMRQCETAIPVKFTIARPNVPSPEEVTVKLTDAMNFNFKLEWEAPRAFALQSTKGERVTKAITGAPLAGLGIETIAVESRAAVRLRAQSGLIVVSADPEGLGYRNGVREGDVIESIDNRITTQRPSGAGSPAESSQTIVLGIVRDGQRRHITIQRAEQKRKEQ